jgi:hypothetical protein
VNEHLRTPSEHSFTNAHSDRLDKFLVECLPDLSRSRIQNLIKEGFVTVDGLVPHKSGQIIPEGSSIAVIIPLPKESQLQPEAIPLDVIFEDGDLIVVNKPAGMVVHPSPGHFSGTLVHAALAHAPEMEGVGGEPKMIAPIIFCRNNSVSAKSRRSMLLLWMENHPLQMGGLMRPLHATSWPERKWLSSPPTKDARQ